MILRLLLFALSCVLIALGLLTAANRAGYLVFVVGPRTLLFLAGLIAVIGIWIWAAAGTQAG